MTHPAPRYLATDRNWPLVAAGALMTCVAIGVVFSLAVFLDPMGMDTGWSRAGISAAMTLAFLSMGVAGFGAALSRLASAARRMAPKSCSSTTFANASAAKRKPLPASARIF